MKNNPEGTSPEISHATVYSHLKAKREKILIALCNCQGNIELLADTWGVSAQDLLLTLKKKNRILKFAESIVNEKGGDELLVAKRLNVFPEALNKTVQRLREIRDG